MKFSTASVCVAITAIAWNAAAVRAQDEPLPTSRMNARRDLEVAKMEFSNYWQIVYPRIRREVDARIDLTRTEIRNYREQLRLYRPFDRFSTGGALVVPLQNLRLCLRDAEWRLRDLRAERNDLIRFRTPEWRALELRLYDARVRVAEIEARADAENVGAGVERVAIARPVE